MESALLFFMVGLNPSSLTSETSPSSCFPFIFQILHKLITKRCLSPLIKRLITKEVSAVFMSQTKVGNFPVGPRDFWKEIQSAKKKERKRESRGRKKKSKVNPSASILVIVRLFIVWRRSLEERWNLNLLLLHGFGGNKIRQWNKFVSSLICFFNVYILDLTFFDNFWTSFFF